jgi:hypothetical protein
MPTFTDENSALGEPSSEVKKSHAAPLIIGVLVATATYLLCKETGSNSICLPIGFFLGACFTSICFQAEIEKSMLIEGEDPCISSEANEIIKPGLKLWLQLQGRYLVSIFATFGILFLYGNPIFIAYMDLRASMPL